MKSNFEKHDFTLPDRNKKGQVPFQPLTPFDFLS